jgi:hypothetical protein
MMNDMLGAGRHCWGLTYDSQRLPPLARAFKKVLIPVIFSG